MSKAYCCVCGMATETDIAVAVGTHILSFCGAHSLEDYQAMTAPKPNLRKQ